MSCEGGLRIAENGIVAALSMIRESKPDGFRNRLDAECAQVRHVSKGAGC